MLGFCLVELGAQVRYHCVMKRIGLSVQFDPQFVVCAIHSQIHARSSTTHAPNSGQHRRETAFPVLFAPMPSPLDTPQV